MSDSGAMDSARWYSTAATRPVHAVDTAALMKRGRLGMSSARGKPPSISHTPSTANTALYMVSRAIRSAQC